MDENITEVFDISNEKINSTRETNESTLSENNTFAGFDDITNVADQSVQKKSSNIPLEVKLKAVFGRYCGIKEKRENNPPKFDEFGVEIPASKVNTDSLPLTLKNFYVDCDQKSNENPRKEYNLLNELGREQKLNVFKMMFLLRCKQEKNDESLEESDKLAEKKTVEISKKEKQCENIERENDVLDSQMAYPSKYASQRKTQPDLETFFPQQQQQQQQPTSSTPHKTLISHHFANTTLASPIEARSPLPKSIEQTPKSSLTNRRWPGMEFLGIKSVFELFTDDENELESIANEPAIQASKHSSDNGIEESQYTVSRILKICEENEKNEQKKNDSSHDSSSKSIHRRLDIGSVRDLFTDDEDDNCIEESQFFDSSHNKNIQNRSSSSSNGTAIYDWNQAASISLNKSDVDCDKDKGRNISAVGLVTSRKSDDLFSTYNESTNTLLTNKNDQSTNCPSTPKKTQDSNLFVYGSPSLLNRSLSALNCYISQSQRKPVSQFSTKSPTITNHTVDKSSTDLNEKLEFLNSQLSISKHFDDSDEIKENLSSPYATCRSTIINSNRETETLLMNGVSPSCDMDLTDDDLLVTCNMESVNDFFFFVCLFIIQIF